MNQRTPSTQSRVSSVELFSDLVFAFAITQLTTLLVNHRTWAGLGHVLLIFGVIWWIYGGYVWLTNAVRPDRPIRKLFLLGAMAGFLMMGLAIPRAFEGTGAVFGIGYLIVVLIHTGLFSQSTGVSTIGRIVLVAPYNLASAIVLLLAGILSGTIEVVLWAFALTVQIVTPFFTSTASFRIETGHFVERYGLLLLIVLGESILAVGTGAKDLPLTGTLVAFTVLGLVLSAALWWSYFERDEERAEASLDATSIEQRPVRALNAYFYAQVPKFLGVVAIAASIKSSLPNPTAVASQSQAWFLAAGVAAFLGGNLWFRTALGIPRGVARVLATPTALATAVVGLSFSTAAQLAALAVLLIATLVGESMQERSAGATA